MPSIFNKRLLGMDEPILEPELPIVDAHFHLFELPGNRYLLDDYVGDVSSGHNVVASVYCETQAFIRNYGPDWLRPVGEVEFANGVAAMAATGVYGNCKIAHGIVGRADLTRGSEIGRLLDRYQATAPDRFRGVRMVTLDYPNERPFKYVTTFRPPAGLLDHEALPLGLAELDKRGLVFDAAVFDPSLSRLTEIVDQFPGVTFVLDNVGCAVGMGMTEQERAEVFQTWRIALRDLSQRPNVACKIGGLGSPQWGFGFEGRPDIVHSTELAQTWRPYIETAIECFGADRCMMESNFPMDGRTASYVSIWNAYKIITRNATEAEKASLYSGTAARIYSLEL